MQWSKNRFTIMNWAMNDTILRFDRILLDETYRKFEIINKLMHGFCPCCFVLALSDKLFQNS